MHATHAAWLIVVRVRLARIGCSSGSSDSKRRLWDSLVFAACHSRLTHVVYTLLLLPAQNDTRIDKAGGLGHHFLTLGKTHSVSRNAGTPRSLKEVTAGGYRVWKNLSRTLFSATPSPLSTCSVITKEDPESRSASK